MDNKPTIHLIAPFNTVVSKRYSHCPFTMKVLNFSKMMKMYNYTIYEYSNGVSESMADKKFQILTEEELDNFIKKNDKTITTATAIIGTQYWRQFHERLITILKQNVKDKDIIAHSLGRSHQELIIIFQNNIHIETGVGYLDSFAEFRVFVSWAWYHWTLGKQNELKGKNLWFVIPIYYDLQDWEVNVNHGDYILYFGRLILDKGLITIIQIADKVDKKVIACGEGDYNVFNNTKVIYKPPVRGKDRNELLKNAYCMIAPSEYIEPFNSSCVESMLCGTPVITSNFGGFTETVIDGVTGFRCNTIDDMISAIKKVKKLDRRLIAQITRDKYNFNTCGKMFDKAFKKIYKYKYGVKFKI